MDNNVRSYVWLVVLSKSQITVIDRSLSYLYSFRGTNAVRSRSRRSGGGNCSRRTTSKNNTPECISSFFVESATFKRSSEKVNGPIRSKTFKAFPRNAFAARKEKTINRHIDDGNLYYGNSINRRCIFGDTWGGQANKIHREKKKMRKKIELSTPGNGHFEFRV